MLPRGIGQLVLKNGDADRLIGYISRIARTVHIDRYQEILVVDACQIKMQHPAVHSSRPHQTGVTERSIRDRDGHACNDIVKDMVVGHLADGVGAGIGAETDGQNHLALV